MMISGIGIPIAQSKTPLINPPERCYSNVNANFSQMFRRNIQETDGFGKNSFI